MLIAKFIRFVPVVALLATSYCPAEVEDRENSWRWQSVSGTGIHYFDDMPGRNVIIHSVVPTETGIQQRSTETIDLFGDLEGRVLYQPETIINGQAGTLVNTGNQVFSGTVLGKGPVLLHDDLFRFDVNLQTGETYGEVFLVDRIDGPRVACLLEIFGTGFDENGNGLAEYVGRCKLGPMRRSAADRDLMDLPLSP
ncbi:MAG: hypothetical protein V2J20_07625 [Wenzhouxiangella sp.]|jgi:hypothetical protein|nr:hypothetical protein [Wenzhouxiangella sp.]